METDRLRYFCAIVDAGSLTKASELLGVSHSGLSKAMSVLQDELGYKVFSPKGRGLELTEKGKSLYEQSRKIIEMVHSLTGAPTTSELVLKVGLPEVLALAISGSISQEFKLGATIEELDSGEIEVRILDRRIDFGFTFVPFPHKELEHLKICNVNLASFARIGSFQNEAPERIPFVIPSTELKENPLSLRIRDGWNTNLARSTPYRANSLSIALKMVQSGACAIYVPNFLVRHLNEFEPKHRHLAELTLTPQRRSSERTTREVFLVKRNREEESKPMKRIAKMIRQICKT